MQEANSGGGDDDGGGSHADRAHVAVQQIGPKVPGRRPRKIVGGADNGAPGSNWGAAPGKHMCAAAVSVGGAHIGSIETATTRSSRPTGECCSQTSTALRKNRRDDDARVPGRRHVGDGAVNCHCGRLGRAVALIATAVRGRHGPAFPRASRSFATDTPVSRGSESSVRKNKQHQPLKLQSRFWRAKATRVGNTTGRIAHSTAVWPNYRYRYRHVTVVPVSTTIAVVIILSFIVFIGEYYY
jgi:hypothetical protein